MAAGVTFYGLLAVFPALTAFISLYGLVADPQQVIEHLTVLETVMPPAGFELLREQALRLVGNGGQELGFALLASVALSLWSANAGMKAIFDALNVAYGEDEKRGFFRLNLISLAFTSGAILFGLLAIVALVAVPVIINLLPLGETLTAAAVARALAADRGRSSCSAWPRSTASGRAGTSRNGVGSAPAPSLRRSDWLGGSAAFSWYVANFADYDATYGAVGAVIGLMTWMWLSAIVILIGAELNSESERQTLRDTTKGPPRPFGVRGADAADRKV